MENFELFGNFTFLQFFVSTYVELKQTNHPNGKAYLIQKLKKSLNGLNLNRHDIAYDLRTFGGFIEQLNTVRDGKKEEKIIDRLMGFISNLSRFHGFLEFMVCLLGEGS